MLELELLPPELLSPELLEEPPLPPEDEDDRPELLDSDDRCRCRSFFRR